MTNLSDRATTGALYGIGYREQDRAIFSGAFAKRVANYSPGGSGAIYRTDRTTGQTALFTTVPGTGTTAHDQTVDMDLGFARRWGRRASGTSTSPRTGRPCSR
ncbi:hypothetical protein [Amycolatopsis alba]|uniref:hypothetical protein n=1 Tax=Amycolatopsis alba TaxID=76020 RepID=UPI0003A07B7D|nr:hypothetical protein [Amycolatopsis alba]